jgi:N-carbamoyl-L-amino-acid hydrolase
MNTPSDHLDKETLTSLRHLATTLLEEVRAATFDGVGVTRASYGEGEERAMALLETFAHGHGLAAERDAGQNLIVRLTREPPGKVLLIGSHLDSVPQGGNFDGLAGVIAGLLLLCHYQRNGIAPPQPIRVLGLRGEESAWFGKAYIGSLGLLGKLSKEDLDLRHRVSGTTLRSALARMEVPIDRIERGEPLLDISTIAAYLEVHIEQGPVMVARQWPVAPVTGIRGNIRHNRMLCKGETGHSGAVPRWLRKDAVLAMSDLLSRLDEHWRVLQQMGMDLVMTIGIVCTNAASHAVSVIPGEVGFSFEVRSQQRDTLEQFYQLTRNECADIEAERGVSFEFDRKLVTEPATMDNNWVTRFQSAGRDLGLEMEPIASGAGHDAAVFANAGVPSAMLFIRNERGSHNPYEAMDMSDFMLGVDILYRAIQVPQ